MAKHPDLTKIKNSIGKVLNDNRETILFSKDLDSLRSTVKILFAQHKIATPKSNEIIVKLYAMTNFTSALLYVQNIIFSAKNMKV
jgi:ribosomal protein S24E